MQYLPFLRYFLQHFFLSLGGGAFGISEERGMGLDRARGRDVGNAEQPCGLTQSAATSEWGAGAPLTSRRAGRGGGTCNYASSSRLLARRT